MAALEDARAAAQAHPTFSKAYLRAAMSHDALGNSAEARVAWQRVLELEPDSKAAKDALARQ